MSKLIPLLFLIIGLLVLGFTFVPIVKYKIWEVSLVKNSLALISPQTQSQVLGVSIQTNNDFPMIVSHMSRSTPKLYDNFQISVPSIGLEDESVIVDSNDLDLGLIHLPGTALPGEKGNVFITGHSALPVLFKKNQKAIFAKLPNIKKGDKIVVKSPGGKFEYQVVNIKVVDPTDLSVIAPMDDQGRFVTLMTCVPPGLNTKRLVVIGRLL